MRLLGRFQAARNARLIAAYEERLAAGQLADATHRHLLGVGISGVVTASSAAKQMRQRQQKIAAAPGADSQYFHRKKIVIGLSPYCLINTTVTTTNKKY